MRFTLPRLTLAALAALALACFGGPASVSAQDLIITGVVDGPLSGGTPKAVELYATSDIADLSAYGISSANNGGGPTGAPEFTFPADAATQGDFIYVASESTEFNNFFSFDPDYTSGAASINGDDAIELFFNGSVVDVFGDVNADGNGEPWEYLDGWAYRTDGTGPDGSTFVLNNWTFSGPDALDGEASNSTAATPFPIGTYQPSASTTTTVQFATGTDAVPEGDGGTTDVTVDVTITNPDAGAATDVTLAVGGTADGADATVSPTSVTFPAGSSAAQTITITVTGDTDAEPDETLELSFASVTGGNSAAAGTPSTYTLTITNDDFDISLPFTEDFEGAGLGAFFAFDVAGPTDVWAQDNDATGNSFADINGFGDEADEDWLISPTFDLSGTTSEELSVDTQERFGGAELELLFSTDYAGTGDPTTATWTELVGPDGGTPSFPNTSDGSDFSPFETTTVSLPSAAATASAVYFAFKYTADGNPGGSEHWRVDNVTLTGSVPVPNAWINEFSYDNDGGDVDEQIEVIVETGADITGLEVVLYNGNGGDPYDTIPLADFTQSTAESQPDFDFYVYNTTNDTPLQNGNDGLALCFNGAVVQSGGVDVLLSYEGEFTANSGCAAGLLLPGIPADAEQAGSTPVTQSVQLQGAGTDYGTLVASSWELDTSSFGTPNANQPLPVELAAFDAVPQPDGAVRLTWSTASETNNAGFEVQQRTGTDGAFRELGFVAGTGTTTEAQTYGFTVEDLPAGTHTFRLRQLDFDGQGTLSPTVETTIEVRGRYALTAPAPNPFAPGRASTMTLTVPETQRVTVAVYNVLGQRVATLFDGTLEANDARELTLPARGLASGVYLYRVQGEGFTATRRATLVR